MSEVRGMAFLGLIRYVKETYGSDSLKRLLDDAPTPTQLACSERIRPKGWYPYEGFAGFLARADKVFGKGDLAFCRTLGAAAAKLDLESTFSAFSTKPDTEFLIRGCALVWGNYYRDAGSMSAIAWEPEHTVLRIVDFPNMHPGHCKLMEGWMIQAMKMIGARVHDDAKEELCMSLGDPCHEFVCTWERLEP